MSSRLFTDLREKNGLSYNVSVDLSYYQECGSFIIYTSFDKDSLFINNLCQTLTLKTKQHLQAHMIL